MASKFPLVLYTGPNQIKEIIAADTVDKAALPSDTVYLTGAQTLTGKTLATGTVAADFSVGSARVLDLAGAGSGTTNDRVKISSQAAGSGAVVETVSSNPNASLLLKSKGSGSVEVFQGATSLGSVVGTTGTQTLTNKTLTQPAISDFTQATHNHLTTAGGDPLSAAAIATGTLAQDRLADQALRSGSYTGGLTTRILRSDGTAAGSGGTAQWTERERIAQNKVFTAQYTSTAASTPNWPNLSQFVLQAADSGWNTLTDCTKESGGTAPFAYNTATLTGKTLRMTAYGYANTIGGSRAISFRIRQSGTDIFTTGYAFTGSITASSIWTLQVMMVYTGSSGSAGSMHGYATCAMVRDLTPVAPITALMNTIGISAAPPSFTFTNGSGYTFDFQAQLTGVSNVGDIIECRSCIWEVLN